MISNYFIDVHVHGQQTIIRLTRESSEHFHRLSHPIAIPRKLDSELQLHDVWKYADHFSIIGAMMKYIADEKPTIEELTALCPSIDNHGIWSNAHLTRTN